DETPSGILLHGIMSYIAEYYSRNLANEVIKGSTQKAKSGGTPMKAPTGYLNVRRVVDGREVRTVDIDPIRGPLMPRAFDAYANDLRILHAHRPPAAAHPLHPTRQPHRRHRRSHRQPLRHRAPHLRTSDASPRLRARRTPPPPHRIRTAARSPDPTTQQTPHR